MTIDDAKRFVEEMHKRFVVPTNEPALITLYGVAIDTLCKAIEDQEERIAIMSEGGWIPVSKRLPEKKETVLLADKYEICFGYLTDYEDFRAVDDCLTEDNRPVRQKYPCSCYEYWMHLPELPKGWALDDEPPKEGDR